MAITLYDATVPNFLRTIEAMQGVFDRGLEHCRKNGTDPNEWTEARIYEDMLPLRYQAQSIHHHSAGAIAGALAGRFSPSGEVDLPDYASLKDHIAKAAAALQEIKPEEVNAVEGKEVVFTAGEFRLVFNAEDFLFSFSVPNFYFHATTAYDILRMKGVPLGKRDFMGNMPIKG